MTDTANTPTNNTPTSGPTVNDLAHRLGGTIQLVWTADLDDAFDTAKNTAIDLWGTAPTAPSLAHFDAGDATPANTIALPEAAAIAKALQQLTESAMEPGQLTAIPVALAKRYTRRRLRVKTEDLTLELPDITGPIHGRDRQLIDALDALIAEQGEPRHNDETYDEIELVRLSQRHKPVVQRHTGPSTRLFALVADGKILGVDLSAADARRSAVEMVKAGADRIEVITCTMRNDEGITTPAMEVQRQLVRRTAGFRLTLTTAKTAETPVDGWVFVGRTHNQNID